MTPPPETASSQRWPALRNPAFRRYFLSRFAANLAAQIQIVAIGWQVYDLTRDPLNLGLIGLSQFMPALALVLVTGIAADRFRRRTIMAVCLAAEAVCSFTLLLLTLSAVEIVWPIFLVLVAFGTARAFYGPAQQSLLPNIVPPEILANAVALNSMTWQVGTIAGPVAGGLLYGIAPEAAYGTAFVLCLVACMLVFLISRTQQKTIPEPATWQTLVAGFNYIWREKIVLGAISLDLFAVLLGGATALLPVYARDILDVGPWGLGLLRSAPAIGAISVAIFLSVRPIRDHAGMWMFVFVGVFGFATTVFGLSEVVWLSVAALIVMGGADMVSVYVRNTMVQLWTPDHVRGRVNAVNSVFVGASNELGEFRAGVSAALIGTVAAVSLGGIGTMAVAALWAKIFPDIRRARHLTGRV
jgi:MFS family permease